MRPNCLFTGLLLSLTATLLAQNPAAVAMRTPVWPSGDQPADGIGWSVFSKQYYSVSNWNLTGLSVNYASSAGHSAVMICRDGIPGFSWYHLYLSHSRQFKKMDAMLQLRFSLIGPDDHPWIVRIGGNILTNWTLSETLVLQAMIRDFPGWVMPSAAVARGDPAMRFLLFHEPGRLIGLAAGFHLSRTAFGPVMAGIRVNLNDRIELLGFMDVLPLGISLGFGYRLNGFRINGWLEQRNGMGLTPVVEFGSN